MKSEFIPKEDATDEEHQLKISQMEIREQNQIKKQQELHDRIERAKEQLKDLELQHKLELEAIEEKRQLQLKALQEKKEEYQKDLKFKKAIIKRENDKISKMKPRTLKENQIVVKDILEKLNCNPIEVLAYIAMGDSNALKTKETIRIYERRAAATELASMVVPKLKPVEAPAQEEVKPIPSYHGSRTVAEDMVPTALLTAPEESDED